MCNQNWFFSGIPLKNLVCISMVLCGSGMGPCDQIVGFLQSSHLPRTTSVQGAVEAAIAAGYRHIDTAHSYRNEVDIGKALRSKVQQGVVRREDMFVVSKVGRSTSTYRSGSA